LRRLIFVMWVMSCFNIDSGTEILDIERSLASFSKNRSETEECPSIHAGPTRVPVHNGVVIGFVSIVYWTSHARVGHSVRRCAGVGPQNPRLVATIELLCAVESWQRSTCVEEVWHVLAREHTAASKLPPSSTCRAPTRSRSCSRSPSAGRARSPCLCAPPSP
jgi:hypothetical protein